MKSNRKEKESEFSSELKLIQEQLWETLNKHKEIISEYDLPTFQEIINNLENRISSYDPETDHSKRTTFKKYLTI